MTGKERRGLFVSIRAAWLCHNALQSVALPNTAGWRVFICGKILQQLTDCCILLLTLDITGLCDRGSSVLHIY